MDNLIKQFPPKDVANAIQTEASEKFEERQLSHPGEFEYKNKDRKERKALLNLIHTHFPPTLESICNILLLDGHRLCSSNVLLSGESSEKITNILIPNWEAGTISDLNRRLLMNKFKKIKLFGCSFGDLVRYNDGNVKVQVVSFDLCSQLTQGPLDDLKSLFTTRIFPTNTLSILDITFCCCREKKGNRQLLKYADEGIDRVDHLRGYLEEMAQNSGCHYTVTTRFSLITNHRDHKMQTAVFVIIPKEIQHEHVKLSQFFASIDDTVREARSDRELENQLPAMDSTPVVAKKKAKSLSLFETGQLAEVNFHDWKEYEGANYSRLPCKIVSFLNNGKEVRVRPKTNKRKAAFSESVIPSGHISDEFDVPIERLEHSMLDIEIDSFEIGMEIESAWRPAPDEPLSWFACIVKKIEENRVFAKSLFDDKYYWHDKKWCRPMKK